MWAVSSFGFQMFQYGPDRRGQASKGTWTIKPASPAAADVSRTRTVESAAVRVEASREDVERLNLVLPGADQPVSPTHWSFGQLAALVGAPAAYLRQLPAPLAGINLQYGLTSHRAEQVKTLETDDGRVELRAVTGPDYGRIAARKATPISRTQHPDVRLRQTRPVRAPGPKP